MVTALQTIVSRNLDPLESAVLSVTMVEAGEADNVISRTAKITGTVRTLDGGVQDFIEAKLGELVPQFAQSFGAEGQRALCARLSGGRSMRLSRPEFAASVAREIAGANQVDADAEPSMGGEDFLLHAQRTAGGLYFPGQW